MQEIFGSMGFLAGFLVVLALMYSTLGPPAAVWFLLVVLAGQLFYNWELLLTTVKEVMA